MREDANAALIAAIMNEKLQTDIAHVKERAEIAANAKRAELVAFAATGAKIDATCLMEAEEDARIAHAEFEIANAIRKEAERQKHESEIYFWFDEAEKLRNTVERNLDERFDAAAEVDLCLASLNQAISRFNQAGQAFSNACVAASRFTADRNARVSVNPVLASMPAGTHPNTKNNYSAAVRRISAAVFDVSGGPERQPAITNLVQREAFLWGRNASETGFKL